ncbi:hypothetical protein GN156_16100 [bacterium LRH843]|nr:hypothetical protein [bacterium LRH843]
MESTIHKHLKKLSLYWLKEKMTDLCANEVKLYVKRNKMKADALGINMKRKEARIIEVKATRSDFLRDEILHSPLGYHTIADYAYLMTPEGLLSPGDIPKGYGWLEVDSYDTITVRRNPVRNPERTLTLETLIKRTGRAATNAVLFQELSKETKDVTGGSFSKDAKVQLISATCPSCKKRKKYLVKMDQQEVLCEARGCKNQIPLDRARKHVITAYNQDFIETLLTLTKDQ